MDGSNSISTEGPGAGWDAAKLKVLLDAGEAAIKRARYVFMTISVAGVLIMSAQFNVSVPWLRNVLFRPEVPPEMKARIQDFLWKDLYVVSMPLVGVKFSAYDLSIVGSVALAVLSVWLFYCARREHHVVSAIAKEAKAGNSERAAYLYYGIAHHFVFMTLTDCDTPCGREPQMLARWAVRVLSYIPIWVPLVVVGVDLWTLAMPHKSAIAPSASLWSQLTTGERTEVVTRFVLAFLIIGFSTVQCRCAARFAAATRSELAIVRKRVEGDPCQR